MSASWGDLHRPGSVLPRPLDRASLGSLLELALGITAWKEHGAARWALRANPSSGNLHPTEGYLLVAGAGGVPAGLHHYLSRDHVLERRWTPPVPEALAGLLPPGVFVLGFASIHLREAWKYGERAFRYCQHDAGHALAAVGLAAARLGWTARRWRASAPVNWPRCWDWTSTMSTNSNTPTRCSPAAPGPWPGGCLRQAARAGAVGWARRTGSARATIRGR